jgi:hypothetical protein
MIILNLKYEFKENNQALDLQGGSLVLPVSDTQIPRTSQEEERDQDLRGDGQVHQV